MASSVGAPQWQEQAPAQRDSTGMDDANRERVCADLFSEASAKEKAECPPAAGGTGANRSGGSRVWLPPLTFRRLSADDYTRRTNLRLVFFRPWVTLRSSNTHISELAGFW